jgi:4-hydroxythreonine-4-phosphate dehydrogenase
VRARVHHVSLREAREREEGARFNVIRLVIKPFGNLIQSPKISAGRTRIVGEGGLWQREIKRSCRRWQRPGGEAADGPLPADTVFSKMRGGMYDLVVVMYHDQGHIPTKLIGFQYDDTTGTWGQMAGVNITLGLPIIRVSVDHGTAFGKAGEGRANPQSMIEAVKLAAKLAAGREIS